MVYRTRIQQAQKGVGLIEVMVAVLILATGMLGMASMQITAKKTGNEAVQRATAAHLAQGLIERMRANVAELDNYVLEWNQGDDLPAADTNCATDACTASQLKSYDLNQWLSEMQGVAETREVDGNTLNTGGLLNPSICVTNATGFVTVAIVWQGFRAMDNTLSTALTDCGNGSGLYGGDDEFRQVMLVSTYITP